ncbi:MAG: histidine phosphatase family protein [Myxococcota bacterium]
MRRIVVASLLAVSACATGGDAATPPSTPPTSGAAPEPGDDAAEAGSTVVFLVRHAEKASDGSKDPPLTEAGAARAECLARMLSDVAVTHVFATNYQRTQKTVAPLAAAKGLEVLSLAASDADALVQQLDGLPPGSVAVAAGHSNTVPALAARLARPLSALDDKGYIPHEQYDRLVEIVRAPGTTATALEFRFCAPSAATAH